MPTVTHLEALEILDCRGVPTLEVSCVLEGGIRGNAAAPAAATRGPSEVCELRDGELQRHRGLGCRKAVALVEGEIRTALVGKRFGDQAALDKALRTLDPTVTRARLGGNTTFAVSLAFARAHAAGRGMPLLRHFAELVGVTPSRLPAPVFALYSHTPAPPATQSAQAEAVERGPLALSLVASGAASVDEALAYAIALRRTAEAMAREKFDGRINVAPDGGLEAPFYDTATLLAHAEQVVRAERDARRQDEGGPTPMPIDWFLRGSGARRFDAGYYRVDREKLTAKELIDRLAGFTTRFPIAGLIDPLGPEDFAQWTLLTAKLPPSVMVAGDDLLATQLVRVEKAAAEKAVRAVVIKPGHTASLTDAARAARFARKAGLALVVSGRSGETEDDWLTDLAVGWGAEYLQAGAAAGSERLAKYNRLLAIEKKTRWPLYRRPPARTTTS